MDFNRISKYFKVVTATMITIFAVVQALDFWEVYDFKSAGIYGFIILIVISVVFVAIKALLNHNYRSDEGQIRVEELNERVENRIGVLKSSERPDKDLIDYNHKISIIERMDILDYDVHDYMSYRIIKGKNVARSNSIFLRYKESTDVKTRADELTLKAYDLKTGKELKVEFEEENEKVFVHNFKIWFTTPIIRNHDFAIIYFMKIPNELSQLSDQDEMMSISLNRYRHQIDRLKFGLYLNFSPSVVEPFIRDEEGGACPLEIMLSIVDTDKVDIDERFRPYISNVRTMCRISIDIDKPKNETYVLNYRK